MASNSTVPGRADIRQLLEDYTCDTDLSDHELEQLNAAHVDNIHKLAAGEILSGDQLDIADGHLCGEAQLPQGSTIPEVVAAVIDAHYGNSDCLRELVIAAEAAGIELTASREVW